MGGPARGREGGRWRMPRRCARPAALLVLLGAAGAQRERTHQYAHEHPHHTRAADEARRGAVSDEMAAAAEALRPYRVRLDVQAGEGGTEGALLIDVEPRWAPLGALRFRELVEDGFYDGNRFFRIDETAAQFGLSGVPAMNQKWKKKTIPCEESHADKQSNQPGYVSFAKDPHRPHTRSTKVFINTHETNHRFDGMGYTPFGKVTEESMGVLDDFWHHSHPEVGGHSRYASEHLIEREGNAYLEREFPHMAFIKRAYVVDGAGKPAPPSAPSAGDEL